jgi:hypothetical protein
VIVSCVAEPAVMEIPLDTAGVSAPLVNRNVRIPTSPVIDKFVNVASPLAFV